MHLVLAHAFPARIGSRPASAHRMAIMGQRVGEDAGCGQDGDDGALHGASPKAIIGRKSNPPFRRYSAMPMSSPLKLAGMNHSNDGIWSCGTVYMAEYIMPSQPSVALHSIIKGVTPSSRSTVTIVQIGRAH